MSALDTWDRAILDLALSFLDQHAAAELAIATVQRNSRKLLAMRVMRAQIGTVRQKLHAMVSA